MQPGPIVLRHSAGCLSLPKSLFQRFSREGHTRSHSEHGSQASLRRWYLAPGPGRVGRRWILEAPRLTAGGLFVFTDRSAALRLHSRDHDSSIRVACHSQPLDGKPSRGPFFFMPPATIPRAFFVPASHPGLPGTATDFLYPFVTLFACAVILSRRRVKLTDRHSCVSRLHYLFSS